VSSVLVLVANFIALWILDRILSNMPRGPNMLKFGQKIKDPRATPGT